MDTLSLIADICRTQADLQSGKYTVYADLLSHLIKGLVHGQSYDGHCFEIARERSAGGTHTLLATDRKDGKRYRITVEPINDPLPVMNLKGDAA